MCTPWLYLFLAFCVPYPISGHSNYALPTAKTVSAWIRATPPRFVFHWKAFGMMTGRRVPRATLPHVVKAGLPAALESVSHLSYDDLGPALQ